jgi:branched-chain amino acid transport system ATP-binding protein
VSDVNFNIAENEILGILGPSGAGKSTIFKMITMSIARSAGEIELIGRDFESPDTYKELT